MQTPILLIASTTLHLFDALIIALSSQKYAFYLYYIDRDSIDDIYFKTLQNWEGNPFREMTLLCSNKTTLYQKVISKRRTIASLIDAVEELQPRSIIVGNDRKTETAALISYLNNQYPIDYMDDGLHSYLLEKRHPLQYTFLDNWLKYLIYGYKIYIPPCVGCSSSIRYLYLYAPHLRHIKLKRKKAFELDTSCLHTPQVQSWLKMVINTLKIDLGALHTDIQGVLFLPHPKMLTPTIYQKLQEKLRHRSHIAIKCHPRDNISVTYFPSHKIIPQELSAELIFLLYPQLKVYSFASTTLLMAKWLAPKLKVYALEFSQNDTPMQKLMQQNHIPLLSIDTIDF